MSTKVTQHNLNLSTSNYLVNCDLLNKYNINSVYKLPNLEKIVLQIPLNSFLNLSEEQTLGKLQNKVKMKVLSFFFFLFSKFAYINCAKYKTVRAEKNKNNELVYYLKITLKNSNDINSFLISGLMEDIESLFSNKNLLKKSVNFSNKNILNFRTEIPVYYFFKLYKISSLLLNDMSLKKFKFKVNFIFKGYKNANTELLFIRNNLHLWAF